MQNQEKTAMKYIQILPISNVQCLGHRFPNCKMQRSPSIKLSMITEQAGVLAGAKK